MCRVLNWTNTLNIVFWETKSRGNIIIYIKLIICNYWFIYIANPMCPAKQCSKCLFNLFYILLAEFQQLPDIFTNRCRTPCTPMPPREAATTGCETSRPILPTCCVYYSTNDGRYCNSLLTHFIANHNTAVYSNKRKKKKLNYASELAIIYQA